MEQLLGNYTSLFALIGSAIVALAVIYVRLKSARKPATIAKIIMPPIGMSTGFFMFLSPATHIPWAWAGAAFLCGAVLFSYPLIATSHFRVDQGKIYLLRSKSFVFILLGLLAIRLILHDYIEQYVSLVQTSSLFFILAFGMLLPWRIVMYIRFQRLRGGQP